MIDWKNSVTGLADIHCHIVPYVDDGAEDYEEAKKLIKEEYSQGVRILVMTVHFRYGMFDTPIDKVKKHFNDLKKWISTTDMQDLELILSREYHCDKRFEKLLDGYIGGYDEVIFEDKRYAPDDEIIPFGEQKCILLEFSSRRIQGKSFELYIRKALLAGFTPIIAHVERYPAVLETPSIIYRMKELGALIQINCESILNKGRTKESEIALKLAKHNLIDIVSSDCHDLTKRSPNMKKCYALISKKYGEEAANMMMRKEAFNLIYNGVYMQF